MKISTMKNNQNQLLELAIRSENIAAMIGIILVIAVFCTCYTAFQAREKLENKFYCGYIDPHGNSDRDLRLEGNIVKGKMLFTSNCAACHAKNMRDKLTGPALRRVIERWQNKKDLYAFIRNPQRMIAKGNFNAIRIWSEYKPTTMTSFPNLKDEEIRDILDYIER